MNIANAVKQQKEILLFANKKITFLKRTSLTVTRDQLPYVCVTSSERNPRRNVNKISSTSFINFNFRLTEASSGTLL